VGAQRSTGAGVGGATLVGQEEQGGVIGVPYNRTGAFREAGCSQSCYCAVGDRSGQPQCSC
jgi:hypothetical protein